ncbi:hypothetical protein ABJI51_27830 [Amycolatopsis sp. NEAU-NG30]|uniref:Uncharacterized protein n=1 Tax=Amycolatopsis melonis TaxID=3156488 RepID=A0ABV0LKR6_9PSEU
MDENYARRLRDWLQAEPGATASEERRWLREIPEPAAQTGQPLHGDHHPAPTPDAQLAPDQGAVNGQLPAADEDWICPVIALPVPRVSEENGCRMSEAESHNRRPMSEAEARSRWNHPSNWHRRRRAEDLRRRDQPGSR